MVLMSDFARIQNHIQNIQGHLKDLDVRISNLERQLGKVLKEGKPK
ncbi:hypothetical protein ES703_77861 [subsurface metagenome]